MIYNPEADDALDRGEVVYPDQVRDLPIRPKMSQRSKEIILQCVEDGEPNKYMGGGWKGDNTHNPNITKAWRAWAAAKSELEELLKTV